MCLFFSFFFFVKARLIKMQGEAHTKDTSEGPEAGLLMQRGFFEQDMPVWGGFGALFGEKKASLTDHFLLHF